MLITIFISVQGVLLLSANADKIETNAFEYILIIII